MPIPIVSSSKATLRQLVAFRIGSWWPETTSSAGNAGGTTAVFSSLIGLSRASLINKYLLITSGTAPAPTAAAPQWRMITEFDTTVGTITVSRAYGGQIASGVTAEIHTFRPELYTLAMNEALAASYPYLYRPVLQHIVVRNTTMEAYGVPLGVRDMVRLMEDDRPSQKIWDDFNRADSATDPGPLWTATSGTWGISTNRLYSVTDTDARLLLPATNPSVGEGLIQAIVRGTLNSGTVYRTPALLFRYTDSSNYLLVRLLNGQVDLQKNDSGTATSLSTGTLTTSDGVDYLVRIMFSGSWVRVWVNDTEYITYQLLGTDLRFANYDAVLPAYNNVGIRWDKAGSPAIAARVDDYRFHMLTSPVERTDWEQSYDRRGFRLGAQGTGRLTNTQRLLWIEGRAVLSPLAADTTTGALASDTSAAVELETTDPAIEVFVTGSAAALYRQAAQPGNTVDATDRATFSQQAKEAYALAAMAKETHGMPQPRPQAKHSPVGGGF